MRRILEIPLPNRVELDEVDVELLKASFEALLALRCERGRAWQGMVQELRGDGWTVRWDLTWHAEARRGEDHEEATGATLDEALSSLAQLTRLDMAGRAP